MAKSIIKITMDRLCMAHASTHGARKLHGPKNQLILAKRPNLIITRNGFDIIVN